MKFSSVKSVPAEVLLLKITCIAWLIAKLYSYKAWITDRNFPIIPTFDFFVVPSEIHTLLFALSLIGIATLLLFPNKKVLIVALIFVEIFSCLLDQMRWQPWEYQYLITLILFVLSKGNKKQFVLLLTFILACTYIFSGLHKFSGGFLYNLWDKMVLDRFLKLPVERIKDPLLHYSGLVFALIEVFIGFGILFFSNKKFNYALAIAMHLIIIIVFGPWGVSHNLIIIPWNLAMIAMLVVLFLQDKPLYFTALFFQSKLNVAVFIIIGVLPFLSFINKWDHYFSFNLYSGTTKTLVICVDANEDVSQLDPYVFKRKHNKYCYKSYSINTMRWALKELKVPVPPEQRIFKKLKINFNNKFPNLENKSVYYWYPYKKDNIKEVE